MIKVNQTEISEHQIHQEMQYHAATSQREAMIKASESLVIAELLRQEARQLRIPVDDQDHFVDRLLEQQVHYPLADDDACKRYFEQNREKFRSSPLLAVRHILLACAADDQNSRSKQLEHANQLIQELKVAPERFEALARDFSNCSSANTGGHLGQLSKGQTVAEFERQLFQSKTGLLPSPIESRYGVHVVLVDQRIEGRPLPFEMVAENIRDYLNQSVRNRAVAQYISCLISQAVIEGFEFSHSDTNLFH